MAAPVIHAGGRLLSRTRLGRLAAAFELSPAEVLADAAAVVDWSGPLRELERVLNARHGWTSDEACFFIRRVRLEVWCTCNGLPDRPPSLPSAR